MVYSRSVRPYRSGIPRGTMRRMPARAYVRRRPVVRRAPPVRRAIRRRRY